MQPVSRTGVPVAFTPGGTLARAVQRDGSMPTVSEPFDFRPSRATLAAALDAFEETGDASGGALERTRREAALAAYPRRAAATRVRLAGWRHDYARLRFADLAWSTGRMRVPALPPAVPGRRAEPALDDDGKPKALAVANAGGIVHLGSTYLQPERVLGDARVVLANLADARRRDPFAVEAILGSLIGLDADPFVALANAFQNCGAFVDVPAGVALDAPLQIVWAGRPGETSAVFAQTVVRVGAGARATIVERHLGERDGFVCGTVEIDLGPGARLDYVVVQNAADGARVAVRRAVRVAGDAAIGWHVADLGAALARTTIETTLAATGASARANVAGFARGFTNLDHALVTSHGAPARSSAVVRTVAIDRTRARLAHTLRTTAGAEGGVASVRADALVLGAGAAVSSRPTFAIATHGFAHQQSASAGTLDREQLFYVQTRGIPLRSAERMIALAFFEPALAGFPSDDLRDEIRSELDAELDEIPDTFTS